MGKTALLDSGMRLGEGTAALAAGIVRAAARTHAGMATFAEAGVSTSRGFWGGERRSRLAES
jgi:nicotinate-nucleotide--dimethylbenzimidazole phosphoribosyltransferase